MIDRANWAIIRTGGKQYRVREGDRLRVEWSRLFDVVPSASDGRRRWEFGDVLAVGVGDRVTAGMPTVAGARVIAELHPPERSDKVVVFKKGRRSNRRRKNGHRQVVQPLTIVAIKPGVARDDARLAVGEPYSSPQQLSSALFDLDADSASADRVALLARNVVATDWRKWDPSDRRTVFEALAPHRFRAWETVGAFVAAAMDRLLADAAPKVPASAPERDPRPGLRGVGSARTQSRDKEQRRARGTGLVAAALRRRDLTDNPDREYQLLLEVSGGPQGAGSGSEGERELFVRGDLLSARDIHVAPGERRHRPVYCVDLSGAGLLPGSKRQRFRAGSEPGVVAHFIVSFRVAADAGEITLEVSADSQRIRRFVDPVGLKVASVPLAIRQMADSPALEPDTGAAALTSAIHQRLNG